MKVIPKYSAPNRTKRHPALTNVPTKKRTEWMGFGVVTTVNAQAIDKREKRLNNNF